MEHFRYHVKYIVIGRKNNVKIIVVIEEAGHSFGNFKKVCAGLNTFPVLLRFAFIINMIKEIELNN